MKNGKQSLLKTFLSTDNSVHDEQLKNEERKATEIDMYMYTRVLFLEVTRSQRERDTQGKYLTISDVRQRGRFSSYEEDEAAERCGRKNARLTRLAKEDLTFVDF